MVRYALIGVADPRHRLLLDPVSRRRAGVSAVGVADLDGVGFEPPIGRPVPVRSTIAEVLENDRPELVGIALGQGVADAVTAAVEAGAAVVALPPLAQTSDELRRLAALVAGGASLRALHSWRQHPASLLAGELLGQGALGAVRGLVLSIGESLPRDQVDQVITELVGLFTWFTRSPVTVVGAPDPVPDPDTLEVSWLVAETADGATLEVWLDRDPEAAELAVALVAERGELQWDVSTGKLVSLLQDQDGQDREPVVLLTGAPEHLEGWVTSEVLRGTTDLGDPLLSTRVVLAAAASREQDGAAIQL